MLRILVTALILLTAMAFAACGDSEPQTSTQSQPAQQSTGTTAPTLKPDPTATLNPTNTPPDVPDTKAQLPVENEKRKDGKELTLFLTPEAKDKAPTNTDLTPEPGTTTSQPSQETTEQPRADGPQYHPNKVNLIILGIWSIELAKQEKTYPTDDFQIGETWAFQTMSSWAPQPHKRIDRFAYASEFVENQILESHWTDVLGTKPEFVHADLKKPPNRYDWDTIYSQSPDTPMEFTLNGETQKWPHALAFTLTTGRSTLTTGQSTLQKQLNFPGPGTDIFQPGHRDLDVALHTMVGYRHGDTFPPGITKPKDISKFALVPTFTDQSAIIDSAVAREPTVEASKLQISKYAEHPRFVFRFEYDAPSPFTFDNVHHKPDEETRFPAQFIILSWRSAPEE